MRMVFLCGHCRGKLAADSSNAGSPVKCPRCQAVVEAPVPDDPGYEFVVEPEPDPEPPPRREREPDPRRKSSGRLGRDARPIRRRSGEMSNGTKAALLGLLGLVLVGGVVVIALFAFSGKPIDPKKGGLAQGGGLLPVIRDAIPNGRMPAIPADGEEVVVGGMRFRLPSDQPFVLERRDNPPEFFRKASVEYRALLTFLTAKYDEGNPLYRGRPELQLQYSEKIFNEMLPSEAKRSTRIRVSGHDGLETVTRLKEGITNFSREVFVGDRVYLLSITGAGLTPDPPWVWRVMDSITIR